MLIPLHLLKIIKSFLTGRSHFTAVGRRHSGFTEVNSGVPQGAVLSPTLFNLFINDAPSHNRTELLLHADGTAMASKSLHPAFAINNIQEHPELLKHWMRYWKLQVNPSKCSAVHCSRRRKKGDGGPLYRGSHEIMKTGGAKFLGVTPDKKLAFKSHVHRAIHQSWGAKRSMLPLLHHGNHLSLHDKTIFHLSTTRPVVTYGMDHPNPDLLLDHPAE
jgi:hypothetical protein